MPDKLVTIIVNGAAMEVAAGMTIGALAERFPLDPKAILVERNGEALHRGEWAGCVLAEGDRIEFIRMVAGG